MDTRELRKVAYPLLGRKVVIEKVWSGTTALYVGILEEIYVGAGSRPGCTLSMIYNQRSILAEELVNIWPWEEWRGEVEPSCERPPNHQEL